MKLLHVPAVLLAAGAAEEAEEAFLAAAARGVAGTTAAFGTAAAFGNRGRFSVSGIWKSKRTTQDSLVQQLVYVLLFSCNTTFADSPVNETR
ncbi:hypothetical protein EYF80_038439 [Liparis tanakae]|uniref:Secreted protein n=1 Tax=Liparis tanakae TaxID=230148 RepID=A0A4Z2GDS8_9TELE|nr:hypothetical protein EYF80_038439 [Liparis tanakae]